MQELLRITEDPRACSYLPQQRASLDIRIVSGMSPQEYGALMARGYRRFGMQIFRPACVHCQQCLSLRIPLDRFAPTGSQRRVLRLNHGIRAELQDAFAAPEHVALFNRYHRFMHAHRGWPLQQTTLREYYGSFLLGAAGSVKQWLYFAERTLVGVALMDHVPGAISLVYCYYDPEWRAQSPGTFSILNQLVWAKAQHLEFAYLGYWVEGCQSLSYKSHFSPHQILQGLPGENELPVWTETSIQSASRPHDPPQSPG